MSLSTKARRGCKYCGKTSHVAFNCFRNPNMKPIAVSKKINPVGRVGKQWLITRATWFRKHPPDEHGGYACYLCGVFLFPNQTTLDHMKPRSKYPELRFKLSNLAPCCLTCNVDKGSKELSQLWPD